MIVEGWLSQTTLPGASELYRRYLAGEALGFGADPRTRPDLESLTGRAHEISGTALDPDLARALRTLVTRLGGSEESQATVDALERGQTVLVFAGQQPAIAGGPLYSLYKAATAVAAARRLRSAGISAAPAFWIASDDADQHEAGRAHAPGAGRELLKAGLTRHYPEGTLVGDLPVSETLAATHTLFGDAGGPAVLVADRAGVAHDLGDHLAALLLRLFASEGLVVVDSRLPELRRVAAEVVDRYLRVAPRVEERVNAAGEAMADAGFGRPLHPESAAGAVFLIDGGGRRQKPPPGTDLGQVAPHQLSAGVVLRPFIQDAVFPTAGFVAGPGELAYLLQTEPVTDLIGVTRAPYLPRLSMTWVDDLLGRLSAEADDGWVGLFADPSPAVERYLRATLPASVREELDRLREVTGTAFERIEGGARELDPDFSQLVAARGRRIRRQLGRLESQALKQVRRREARQGRVLANVSSYLLPRRRLQERVFSMLWPLSHISPDRLGGVVSGLAVEHLERAERGDATHAIVSLDRAAALTTTETTAEALCRTSFESA